MLGESFGKKELARATFVGYERPAWKDDLQQQCQRRRVHNQYTLNKQENKPHTWCKWAEDDLELLERHMRMF